MSHLSSRAAHCTQRLLMPGHSTDPCRCGTASQCHSYGIPHSLHSHSRAALLDCWPSPTSVTEQCWQCAWAGTKDRLWDSTAAQNTPALCPLGSHRAAPPVAMWSTQTVQCVHSGAGHASADVSTHFPADRANYPQMHTTAACCCVAHRWGWAAVTAPHIVHTLLGTKCGTAQACAARAECRGCACTQWSQARTGAAYSARCMLTNQQQASSLSHNAQHTLCNMPMPAAHSWHGAPTRCVEGPLCPPQCRGPWVNIALGVT